MGSRRWNRNDKDKPSGPQKGAGGKLGVVIDYSAMKAADWIAKTVLNLVGAVSPELSERVTAAVKLHREEAELMLVGVMQVLGNTVLPFLPGRLSDRIEDVIAKLPSSVTSVLDQFANKTVPADYQFSKNDLPKLEAEIITRIKSLFTTQVGLPMNLVMLCRRSVEGKVDYIEKYIALLKQVDGTTRTALNQLLVHGEIDYLVYILDLDPGAMANFGEAFSLLTPKGKLAGVTERVGRLKKTTLTPDVIDRMRNRWNGWLTAHGCRPIPGSTTPAQTATVVKPGTANLIVTPDKFTPRERRITGV